MAKYQKVPEIIEAMQMNKEAQSSIKSWPDWAIAARNKDSRQIGSIFLTDPENPEGSFSIRTEYDVFEISPDSWVVNLDEKAFMLMTDEHFSATYVPSDATAKTDVKPAPVATTAKKADEPVGGLK